MGVPLMAEYHGSHKWRPGWGDPVDVQRWIERGLATGTLLNIPCGESTIGDVRVDVDPERQPDMLVDMYNLPFGPRSFDSVYFDPPFEFMWSEGWQDLLESVWELADQRLIAKTPRRRLSPLPNAEKSWRVAEPKPGSPQFQVWLFQVYDRTVRPLDEFAEDGTPAILETATDGGKHDE